MPNRPQWFAGPRTEPPVSLPSAMSQSRFDTAEAEPEDEPPGMRSGAPPFTGVPKWAFLPESEKASSSVIVLPTKRAPALEQPLDHRRAARLHPGQREHMRRAAARRIAGDVVEVLDPERQPGKRP